MRTHTLTALNIFASPANLTPATPATPDAIIAAGIIEIPEPTNANGTGVTAANKPN